MAWKVTNHDLSMAEEDFGIVLPVVISGTTLTANDTVRFTIKTAKNGEVVLTKEYTPDNNTVNLEITEVETGLLPVGEYAYSLDWYQGGAFMCNIIPVGSFKVVDKA